MQEYVKQIENGERGSSSNRMLCNNEYTDGDRFTPNKFRTSLYHSEDTEIVDLSYLFRNF